jgi:hypothetical protein
MPKAKNNKPSKDTSEMHIRGSYVGGDVTISGNSKFVGGDDNSKVTTMTFSALFQPIYHQIDQDPQIMDSEKPKVKELVKEVETEISQPAQPEQPNQRLLTRLFKDIQGMAPDMVEVITATALNPVAGLSLAAKKIIQKAASEAKASAPPAG